MLLMESTIETENNLNRRTNKIMEKSYLTIKIHYLRQRLEGIKFKDQDRKYLETLAKSIDLFIYKYIIYHFYYKGLG